MRRRIRAAVAVFIACGAFAVAGVGGSGEGGIARADAANPTLSFSGYTWTVKTSSGAVGPGPNIFSASNAWVDSSARLHLAITKQSRKWTTGEVILNGSYGYGTYEWELGSNVSNLDANVVLGLFTWNDLPDYNHREIDFEAAKWGNTKSTTNAQWVVQPATSTNLRRWSIGSTVPTIVRFTWAPGSVQFQSVVGGNVVNEWNYTGADVPLPGGENARMNLWLYQGRAPKNGLPAEVILNRFTYTAPA